MKKIFFVILFMFLLNFNSTYAFSNDRVDILLNKIEYKLSSKPLITQLNIYKKIRKRISLLNKTNNGKNKEIIEYLYFKIDKKFKSVFKKYAYIKKDNKIDIVKNTNSKVYFKLEDYNKCLDLKVKTLYLYKNGKKIEILNNINGGISNVKIDGNKLYFNRNSQISGGEKIYDIENDIFIKGINCENCKKRPIICIN